MCLGWRSDSDPCTSLPKAVQSYQNSRQADNYHLSHHQSGIVTSMLRQPNVHLWTSWRSCEKLNKLATRVVNYSQIFCTFAVETTCHAVILLEVWLWIALKFFVLLQSKQRKSLRPAGRGCCELLSNFLYFCSRNNALGVSVMNWFVVNCSQIFCTFAVETTQSFKAIAQNKLWIALKFFVLLQSKQPKCRNCHSPWCCELLSNFLYFCSRNNHKARLLCSPRLWIALKFFVLLQSKQPIVLQLTRTDSCELLSNFLYFCSRNNLYAYTKICRRVVNCSQIFCTFAVETTEIRGIGCTSRCELLSNFLYFCSRNN